MIYLGSTLILEVTHDNNINADHPKKLLEENYLVNFYYDLQPLHILHPITNDYVTSMNYLDFRLICESAIAFELKQQQH